MLAPHNKCKTFDCLNGDKNNNNFYNSIIIKFKQKTVNNQLKCKDL